MADGKWITDVSPDAPAQEAAGRVLAARFGYVVEQIYATAEKPRDTEPVHQLRVATRRAGAALHIFENLIPKKRLKRAKGALRSLRRAAGSARDWDVFLQTLERSETVNGKPSAPAVAFLTGYALGHRAAAQDELNEAVAEHRDDAAELVESLSESVRKPKRSEPRTFAAVAAAQLEPLFAEFNAEIAADPTAAAELHQLRITAKRLRYAMEVFAGCYSPAFRDELYPAVERLQEILGAAQDGHVAVSRLQDVRAAVADRPDVAAAVKPGLDSLEAELLTRSEAAERDFHTWKAEWAALAPPVAVAPPAGG